MNRLLLCLALIITVCNGLYAQKQTTHVAQFWTAYLNQTRFSDHWGLWADVHLRMKEDVFSNLSTSITRLGLTYFAHDKLRFTAGYAFVNHFPADPHTDISRPEHRPWQQIQWMANSPKSRLTHALRLEERFLRKVKDNDELANGHNYSWRLRYNFLFMLPLNKNAFQPKTLSLAFNNEVMVSFGKAVVNNYFDQNRFFLGLAYHVNPGSNVQFGYLNVFQQLPAGNKYRSINGPRIFYFHNIDLRKK